jgi:DNA-binding response OmpR family regulator
MAGKKCVVLVVEDDHDVQELLKATLRKTCTTIDVADDGERAVEMLRSGFYDVVILDLMLPRLNGLGVLEAIQSLARPPKVIVLSAISRYFADRMPADTIVLQKPFDIDRIDEALRSLELI